MNHLLVFIYYFKNYYLLKQLVIQYFKLTIHSIIISTMSVTPPVLDTPLLTSPPTDYYQLYRSRFYILFTFSLLSFNQSLFWITFSPICKQIVRNII